MKNRKFTKVMATVLGIGVLSTSVFAAPINETKVITLSSALTQNTWLEEKEELMNRIKFLESEVIRHEENTENAKRLINIYEGRISTLKLNVEVLEKENTDLKLTIEKFVTLEKDFEEEIISLKSANEILQKEMTQAKEINDKLYDENEKLAAEIKALKEANNALEKENNDLNTTLKKFEQQYQ